MVAALSEAAAAQFEAQPAQQWRPLAEGADPDRRSAVRRCSRARFGKRV
jgi:hypothetical protein